MIGDVLYSGSFGKLKNIPFKGFGVSAARVAEPYFNLPDQVASLAENPLNRQGYENRLEPDGNRPKPTQDRSPFNYPATTAMGTDQFIGFVLYGENHCAAFIVGANILIASDAESVIQKTGGHDGASPLIDVVVIKEVNLIVHIPSTHKVRFITMSLFL
jgi:hypothetical protein